MQDVRGLLGFASVVGETKNIVQLFCSHEATKERHRRNLQAYRQTVAGKENHKVHQQTYRARKKIPRVIDLQS